MREIEKDLEASLAAKKKLFYNREKMNSQNNRISGK